MNRIEDVFQKARSSGKKAVIFFVTAGDPSFHVTSQFLRFAERTGADLVELGVPFSDPLADGVVIQSSSTRAIHRGVNLSRVLKFVRSERLRGLKIPLVLMTSFNIIYRHGVQAFRKRASLNGVDGYVIPDLPLEEAERLLPGVTRDNMRLILMLSPTTSKTRELRILESARGFLYYISLTGVTGERKRNRYPFRPDVIRLRKKTSIPLCVGFGISSPAQARDIARFSDGVIIGSALVRHLSQFSQRTLSPKTRSLIEAYVRAVKSI